MMIACLYSGGGKVPDAHTSADRVVRDSVLVSIARDFSPRIEIHAADLVTLDVSGLGRLLGDARAIGEELRRTAVDRGVPVHVALASTRTAALILAHARAGLTIIEPGAEAATLAPLPLNLIDRVQPRVRDAGAADASSAGHDQSTRRPRHPPPEGRTDGVIETLKHWGLKTIGDLAALPPADLFERLGSVGLEWQRLARGEDVRPLVPAGPEDRFEETLQLEWPIEGLEPLSFVLGRLLEPLAIKLEQSDRGAAVLHVRLRLVTREIHARSLELPSPIRDPRVLRTLILLDLESHPPSAGIDSVTVTVDPTPGRILQFSLITRPLPSAEQLSPLLARLTALMGEGRVGSPALVDSYAPGAFEIHAFRPPGSGDAAARRGRAPRISLNHVSDTPAGVRRPSDAATLAVRRFRLPIPARVLKQQGRPVRVETDRPGLQGGCVVSGAGPWRTSGHWWSAPRDTRRLWNRDEWDVALGDGGLYRIYRDRDQDRWFIDGVID
jgi:protein ImuB